MPETRSAVVDCHFFRFSIATGDEDRTPVGESLPASATSSYLAQVVSYTDLVEMQAARHYGEITVAVAVHGSRPQALQGSWTDVAEFSLVATDSVVITDFEPNPARSFLVPLTAGEPYRVRYAISDMDDGASEPPTERYSLEFWTEAPSDAVAQPSQSARGRRAQIDHLLSNLVPALREIGSEDERIAEYCERALTQFPELGTLTSQGRPNASLRNYALQLMDRRPFDSTLTPEHRSAQSEQIDVDINERLTSLINELDR